MAVLVGALAVLGAPPAGAVLKSDNVSLVTKLPEAVGAASGRFSPDGKTFYVSTWKGLHVYDVSKPDDPQRKGFLPLPHFENEDVDAGDGIVIVSNDPSEGVGVIYVIDVTDPSLPKIRSVMPNGFISTVGGLVQSPNNTGHIANCIQGCKWLWLTGTAQGLEVVDLRDPDKPAFVKTIPMPVPKARGTTDPAQLKPGFTHDVFVDRSGIGWVTGQDGTFGFDTANPTDPALVYRSDENVTNSGQDGPDGTGEGPLDFLHHNSIRTSISLAGAGQPADAGGGEAGGGAGPGAAPGTVSAQGQRAKSARAVARRKALKRLRRDLKRCRKGKRAKARARCARKVRNRYRKALAAASHLYGSGGTQPAAAAGGLGDVMAITEEDYTRPTCQGQGSLQTWQITGDHNSDGTTKLTLLDQWTTELNELADQTGRSPATILCSAHWFDESGGLLAQGWYDQGVRFLDVSDPRNIRQVGYWVTAGTFWAAYFAPTDTTGQTVYGLDVAGGIDVLHIDRTGSQPAVSAPATEEMLAEQRNHAFVADPQWRYACPIASSAAGVRFQPS